MIIPVAFRWHLNMQLSAAGCLEPRNELHSETDTTALFLSPHLPEDKSPQGDDDSVMHRFVSFKGTRRNRKRWQHSSPLPGRMDKRIERGAEDEVSRIPPDPSSPLCCCTGSLKNPQVYDGDLLMGEKEQL
ncbi:hypothetical protein Y1Q_0010134 [Alligator mississippiensis]|uniref:Uncharacterized protein n=1 Tax=Alligator mississippiensis TaxID=8496 RepID=A0A151NFT2_ALLMI|nr:hypothetical protein Y1Q_0010134 [Alligator mississippiensis]